LDDVCQAKFSDFLKNFSAQEKGTSPLACRAQQDKRGKHESVTFSEAA